MARSRLTAKYLSEGKLLGVRFVEKGPPMADVTP